MKEKYYEELLNIKTTGDQSWDETKKCYHPYKPTPYFALDKLFESYYINEKDSVIDFGCGKGRLNFYLNYNYNCNVLGIEMDENFYNQCMENKKEYLKNNKREEDGEVGIKVEAADGEKCERCWMYSETVGKNHEHPTLCKRCVDNLE